MLVGQDLRLRLICALHVARRKTFRATRVCWNVKICTPGRESLARVLLSQPLNTTTADASHNKYSNIRNDSARCQGMLQRSLHYEYNDRPLPIQHENKNKTTIQQYRNSKRCFKQSTLWMRWGPYGVPMPRTGEASTHIQCFRTQ